MRIMLVDDEQLIVDGLKKIILRRFPGAEVSACTDPAEALEQMRREKPELLITDIRMPEITGLQLIPKAREAGVRYCAVLTGLDDVPLLQESIRLQVCDYLIKPVNKEELFALILRTEERIRQEGTEHANEIARMFRSGEWDDARTAQALTGQIRRSDCVPLALDAFLAAAGREQPFWETCRMAASMVKGEKTDAEAGAALRGLPAARTPSSPEWTEILADLRERYAEELTVAQAASKMYLQPNYFTTLFKKETGKGFIQYLNQLRIEEVCRRILTDPGQVVQEAAERCGFSSPRYFYTVFRKQTGVTPGEFRKEMEDAGFIRS